MIPSSALGMVWKNAFCDLPLSHLSRIAFAKSKAYEYEASGIKHPECSSMGW